MQKYFIEFEFKTSFENHYWFPLLIESLNLEQAKIITKTVETALKEHYDVKKITTPKLYIKGLNSDYINEYIKQRFIGTISILEFDVWRFKEIPTIPELNFTEHLGLIEFTDDFSDKNVANLIAKHDFPVRLYYNKPDLDFKEFLLVNVVDPLKAEELYICITLSEKDFQSSNLTLIAEGIWKDAHLTGYKVRVDAPHIPDGKRHVHIAHSKHVNAKSQQVSWNDDLTRHDKKSFNKNFKGLERAKEIARKELGLKDDAILEQVEKGYSIILESEGANEIENEIIYLQF